MLNYLTQFAAYLRRIGITMKYLMIMLGMLFPAAAITVLIWSRHAALIHTLMEAACIFIAIAAFAVVWYLQGKITNISRVMGFGFLSVAIFDLLHTIYYLNVRLYPDPNHELTVRYWIVGRLVEALILIISTLNLKKLVVGRWTALFLTLSLSSGVAYAIFRFPGMLPPLIIGNKPTIEKNIFEYIVTVGFVYTVYRLRRNAEEEDIVVRHIVLALLIAIPAEICFTLYKDFNSLIKIYGHFLKIAYYYQFFRAIFASSVTYPHIMLETERNRIRQMNEELNAAHEALQSAHLELRELNVQKESILNALPLGIGTYDETGRMSFANEVFGQLFGCKRESLCGLTAGEILERFPKLEGNENLVEAVLKTEAPVQNLIRTYRRQDGSSVKLAVSTARIEKGAMVLLKDAKREQALENMQIQTKTILNAINSAVVILDSQDHAVMINDAGASIAGLSVEEVQGREWSALMKQLNLNYIGSQPDVSRERPWQEYSITTPDGNLKYVLTHISPIYNIEGELIGKVNVTSDITDLKRQQQIIQQQEKLAAIGQMAAGIVHEIKNPLATIKGLCQIMKSKVQDDKQKEYMRVVSGAVDDINHVVNDFLNLAKPKPVTKQVASVNGIVGAMQLFIETQCFTKNIKSSFVYAEKEMPIMADERQIKQVILNLCENAIDAMAGIKDPILRVRTECRKKDGCMLIVIEDNGIGMTEEIRKKIGKSFFTTKEKGTGLGLNVCWQIVEDHNGSMEIVSELNKGAAFIISLPCCK